MPTDPAPLTEAEREILEARLRGAIVTKPDSPDAINALVARKLIEPCHLDCDPVYWPISDAGRSALIEAAVAERFAKLDALLGSVARTDADEAILRLAAIARDQERRLMRLEQQRGGDP